MKRGFKQILATAAAALTVAGMASLASAAGTVEINLYGASAQYFYWNDVADQFLAATYACTTIEQAEDTDKKNGITRGTGCNPDSNTTYIIRYSSKASFDGIDAMKGRDADAGAAEKCAEGAPGVPAGKAKFYRQMADESTVIWGSNLVSTRKCVDITLGASDVAAGTFVQNSSGYEKPCKNTTSSITRNFSGLDASGLVPYRPLVVPFAFFVNKTALPDLTNLTRLQAVMIFSNTVKSWRDFGPTYPDKYIVKCLRHAGSGTHATLDAAVMRGDYNIVTSQGALQNKIRYFNDGSSDMMSCVDKNGCPINYSTTTHGAVGYADADQGLSSYPNVAQVNYMGAAAVRDNIKFGVYEFWSTQWIYEDPAEPGYADKHPVVLALMNYASNPANLPPAKALYWATANEMKVKKSTDFTLPTF